MNRSFFYNLPTTTRAQMATKVMNFIIEEFSGFVSIFVKLKKSNDWRPAMRSQAYLYNVIGILSFFMEKPSISFKYVTYLCINSFENQQSFLSTRCNYGYQIKIRVISIAAAFNWIKCFLRHEIGTTISLKHLLEFIGQTMSNIFSSFMVFPCKNDAD